MKDSESRFLPPKLPPKRPALDTSVSKRDAVHENVSEQEQLLSVEVSPEELAAFEEEVKNSPSSVSIDLPIELPSAHITAPILEDYIDPFAVPILYLLDEASAAVPDEENPEDSSETDLSQI